MPRPVDEDEPAMRPASHSVKTLRVPLWAIGYLLIAVYATLLAYKLRPAIFVDDAAIGFRFVARIVAGKGFTYNDHERVLGASNPLYVLVLAGLASTGLNIETAARGLALVLFVASVLIASVIAARLSNRLGGFLCGMLLASQPFFRSQMLSGMESALAVFLGLLVLLALLDGRDTVAAVLLGLAVWNKLDAGMLAIGAAAAWVVVLRKPPLKLAVLSFLVVLPWFAFATWYFGSPLPHSMTAKLAGNSVQLPDRLWPARFIFRDLLLFMPLASTVLLPVVWRGIASSKRLVVAALVAWFVFHWIALTVLWFGDRYAWYLTVLYPPPVILACAAGFVLLRESPRFFCTRSALVATGFGLMIAGSVPWIRSTLTLLRMGSVVSGGDAFDFDRRLAGRFLARYANPSEVVASGYGWVAYEIPNPFNDYSSLCSRVMRQPEAYFVLHGMPWTEGSSVPTCPDGYIPLATFNLASDLHPGWSWFTVFGTPESAVARSGKRFVQLRLFELSAPKPYSDEYGLDDISVTGTNLLAHPPSGATFTVKNSHQPVHIVFTPAFDPKTPADKTDGATFEVRVGDALVYHHHLLPAHALAPVILSLGGAPEADELMVSLITTPGPHGDRNYDWVYWRSVKVVIGDAYVDLPATANEELVREWTMRNPVPDRP